MKTGARIFAAILSLAAFIAPASALENPPNAAAITARHALPGLDEGFIPQGLTLLGGEILLAGYMWPLPGKQACRVYRIAPVSGTVTGLRDLATPCGHAGGLAHVGARLFLADTARLIELDAKRLFDPAASPVIRSIALVKPLTGSFAAGSGSGLWIGRYATDGSDRLWRFPLAALDRLAPDVPLDIALADHSIPAPPKSQGAAFAPDGTFWVSQSGSAFGRLSRINPANGAVVANFDMPAGIEDIGFASDGGLWASSEAGSKRWSGWNTKFPFVFQIDVSKLR